MAIGRVLGERCEPLAPPWPGFVLLLVNPGASLPTADVFRAYDRAADAPPPDRRPFPALVRAAAEETSATAPP